MLLCAELLCSLPRISLPEDAMKAYLANLPINTWAVAAVTVVLVAYPIGRLVVPAVLHAVVPDVVRTVLNLI